MTIDFIKEIITYLLTAISSAVASGTVIHFKAKKKIENQKARQEENVANQGLFENLQKEISFLDKRLEIYRKDQENYRSEQIRQEKKISGMQRILTITIGQKKYAEKHICLNIPCLQRIPVLGTYQTAEESIDKEQENS